MARQSEAEGGRLAGCGRCDGGFASTAVSGRLRECGTWAPHIYCGCTHLESGNLVPTRPRPVWGTQTSGSVPDSLISDFHCRIRIQEPRLDPGVAARPRSTSRVRNPEAQSGATAQLPTAQLPHPRCSSCCLGGQDKWPAVLLDLSVEWSRRSMVKRPIWNEVGEWGHPLFCLMVWSLQTRPHSRQLPRGAPARCTPWSDLFLSFNRTPRWRGQQGAVLATSPTRIA